MQAGTNFGERVATIHYRDITGIEVSVGMLQGVIEISTASYSAQGKKSVWKVGSDQDPWLQANCIPFNRPQLKAFESPLAELRRRVDAARQPSPSVANPGSVAGELERLAELFREGLLTPEEFASAKAELLHGARPPTDGT